MLFITGNSKRIVARPKSSETGRRSKRLIFYRPTLHSVTGYRVPNTTIRRADVLNLERTLAGGKTNTASPAMVARARSAEEKIDGNLSVKYALMNCTYMSYKYTRGPK